MTVLFKPILALHINFSSCQNYWGGKTICLPPQYFHWGTAAPSPQPPRIDASGAEAYTLNCGRGPGPA